jgi:hypothetical protein
MPGHDHIGLKKGSFPQYIVWLLLLGFTSCGYHFPGKGGSLPVDVRSVAIPTFANSTQETGIESLVTQAMVEKFVSTRTLLITGQNSADSLLTGSVRSFVTSPITVTSGTQTTTEYHATLTVEIIFKRQDDGRILAKEELSEWRNYPVVANNPADTERNKREAIRQIAALLAEKVYELVLENF